MKCIDFQTYFHSACIFKGSGLCSLVVFVLRWFMGLVWPGWWLWKAALCGSSNFHFKRKFYKELREVTLTRDPRMNRRSARLQENKWLRQNRTSEALRVCLCAGNCSPITKRVNCSLVKWWLSFWKYKTIFLYRFNRAIFLLIVLVSRIKKYIYFVFMTSFHPPSDC